MLKKIFQKTIQKQVIVSGVKPTNNIHFGNYFGAMKQNIDLVNSGKYESFIFIADLHALNSVKNKKEMTENIFDLVATYIALGLDIKKTTFFKQSDNPHHSELSIIFENFITMPHLMRAHAFKDHEVKNKEVSVGLFTYPILMSADILLYKANLVPVGKDQKQHIEYARDIAGFFNKNYQTEYFNLPKDYILEEVGLLPGIDGEKMSKSKNNHLPIFCHEEELKKRIMSIKTDSLLAVDKKDPDTNNVYNIHKHFLLKEEDKKLREKFLNGGYAHKDSKEDLIKTILNFRKGKIEIYNKLKNNQKEIQKILDKGKKKSLAYTEKIIKEIRQIIGIDF